MSMTKYKTPAEKYLNEKLIEVDRTAKMQRELNTYGRKTACGGTVWTAGDLQRYFNRSPASRKKYEKVAAALRKRNGGL